MGDFVPEVDLEDSTILVLHVDDEPTFTSMAAEMLRSANPRFEVVTADGAGPALDVLDERDVNCVVSDYEMPGRSGLDLLRAVRERSPELPFILFTGKGSEDVASEAISAGVTDYLRKQGSADQFDLLANRIENTVKKHRAQQELRRLKRRYEMIAKSTTDALWEWEIEGESIGETDTVRRSSGFYRSFGYEDEDIADEFGWWIERVHPDDRADARAAIDEVLAEGREFYEDAHRFRRADGTYTQVIARGYVEYEDGDPVWMVGSYIDENPA